MLALNRWFGLGGYLRTRFALAELKRIVQIGLPVCFTHAAYATCFLAIMKTSVAPLGASVQAGLAVGFNGIESVSYCGLMGPAMAASSIVGRRLGAQDYLGAKRGAMSCLGLSVGFATLTSIVFVVAGGTLAGFFTEDPEVLQEATAYLTIVALSQVATAAYSTIQQMMTGAGRTVAMAYVSVGGNLARVPLAWWFALGLGFGASGIWWALNVGNFLKLGAIFLLFRRLHLFSPASETSQTSRTEPQT